ncbi:MAG: PxKF domain-containing protein [Actinobacteria bacterium]|nr:PxKF domain-containing protein [Actinomycetota bacterium]
MATWGRAGRRIALATALTAASFGGGMRGASADHGDDVHPPPPATNVTLATSAAGGPAGISDIDLATLDVGALPLFTGGPESAPMRSTPMRSTPMRSTPMRSTPMRSTPMRSTPLKTLPMRSTPMRSTALPPMPLSTVPLFVEGGWETILDDTIYDGVSLNAVTLQQVLAIEPAPAKVAGLTLNDIDLASTPMRSTSLQGFLFAGPSLDALSATADWCGTLGFAGFSCASAGIDEATSSLFDLDVAGAPLDRLWFLPGLTLAEADLTAAPIAFYDVAALDVERNILGDITTDLIPQVVNCEAITCGSTTTLADAVAALSPSATTIHDPAELRLLLADADLAGVRAQLTFEDLVRAAVDPANLLYDGIPLPSILDATGLATDDGTPTVRYTADADVECYATDTLGLSVTLPRGFAYIPGSSTQQIGSDEEVPRDDPIAFGDIGGVDSEVTLRAIASPTNTLGWVIDANCQSAAPSTQHVRLSFLVRPGVELGTKTSTVTMHTGDGNVTVPNTAPFAVGDAFEPNGTQATATAITPDTMYLSHIADGSDVDVYTLPTPMVEGTRITAVLSHLPTDFDLFLDGPRATALRPGAPITALRQLPVEDLGYDEVPTPETLQDTPMRSTPLSASDNRGVETEIVSTIVREETSQPYTITVGHHLGTNSPSPYLLQVRLDPPPELTCAAGFSLGSGGTAGQLPSKATLPADAKTIFLVNQKRMGDAFGATATNEMVTALDTLGARDEVKGIVLPVDGDATVAQAYATWDADRCSPEAANDVSRAINVVSDSYLTAFPQVQYLVAVGDDDIIPFTRTLDDTVLSNQRDYYDSVVFPGGDNAISAAYAYGMVLTDNGYTDRNTTPFLTGQLVDGADLAGGRLVETPTEIMGAIQQYETKPYVDMSRAVTTGYDFIGDLADAVAADLTAKGVTVSPLNNETWTASELTALLDAATPTVASINAHYDHSDSLPAQGNSSLSTNPDLFSSQDLATSGLDLGALLFTVGCQAGLNVPGRAWVATAETPADEARLLDFAQALARDKRAIGFLANTGFGYGDTEVVGYGERFIELFTQRLDGTMTVGQAVRETRKAYTQEGTLGVYDAKVVAEATFYGFPFAKVGSGGAELPATGATPGGAALPVDPTLDVQAAEFDKAINLTAHHTDRGTYYTANGFAPTAVHDRPIAPTVPITLPPTPAGTVQGDVLITGLISGATVVEAEPVFSTPVSDRSAFATPGSQDSVFPVPISGTTPQGGALLYPSQFRSGDAPGSGTQVNFDRITGKVLYPTDLTGPRPSFADVEATTIGDDTVFQVKTLDSEYVVVLYRTSDSATWRTAEMTAIPASTTGGATSWSAIITGAGVAEYFVQAVRDGQVGTTRAKGLDYEPTTPPAPSGLSITVSGPLGTNGWYRATPTVTVTGGQNVVFEASLDGGAYQPVGSGLPITGTGLHTVELRGSDGSTGRTFVAVDDVAPTVAVTTPTEGQRVTSTVEASFSCADVGTGVASCTALGPVTLDKTAGNHQFRVEAVDNAGNVTVHTVNYVGGYLFEGFFEPVENGMWNLAQAGSSVPMKFRVKDSQGLVTDTGVVTATTSDAVACPSEPGAVIQPDLLEATSAAGLKWDATAQQFVYTWKTAKTFAETCRKFMLSLDDGSTHTALFQFK